MNLMTIPSEPQLVVKGVLILVSVIFIGRKRGQRKLPRRVLAVDRDNESAAGE